MCGFTQLCAAAERFVEPWNQVFFLTSVPLNIFCLHECSTFCECFHTNPDAPWCVCWHSFALLAWPEAFAMAGEGGLATPPALLAVKDEESQSPDLLVTSIQFRSPEPPRWPCRSPDGRAEVRSSPSVEVRSSQSAPIGYAPCLSGCPSKRRSTPTCVHWERVEARSGAGGSREFQIS